MLVVGNGPTTADEAWMILLDREKVNDPEKLNELIITLGLNSGNDLMMLQQNEIADIAITLKSIPQRRFLQLF